MREVRDGVSADAAVPVLQEEAMTPDEARQRVISGIIAAILQEPHPTTEDPRALVEFWGERIGEQLDAFATEARRSPRPEAPDCLCHQVDVYPDIVCPYHQLPLAEARRRYFEASPAAPSALVTALTKYGRHLSTCRLCCVVMRCDRCGGLLDPVRQGSSNLNREQFDAVKAGDWYCSTCPGKRGESGRRYFWESEMVKEPCDCGLAVALAAGDPAASAASVAPSEAPEEAALAKEREACVLAVDAEEELDGLMPVDLWDQCVTREGATEVYRAAVRATKRNIRARILAPTATPAEGVPPAAPDAEVEQRLAAIRARVEAATPGPWEAPLRDLGAVPSFKAMDFYFDHSYEAYPPLGESGPVFVAPSAELAAFLAHAREDIPYLLTLVAAPRSDATPEPQS